MSNAPKHPKIYHITPEANLPSIIECGLIWSDAQRIAREADCTNVGMPHIKMRRLKKLEVKCHPDTKVGDYVPFYYCPRSVMLYIFYRADHPDLTYRGGQRPIVHLQADMKATIKWAESNERLWAFTDRNAGSYVAKFFDSLGDMDEVNWTAVNATDFRNSVVKEGKQAEFLIHESFPWQLVEKIGVRDAEIKARVEKYLELTEHRPLVNIKPKWYY